MPEAIATAFQAWPYFGNAVMMTLLLGLGLWLFPAWAPAVLRSALLALPWGVLWPLTLVPDYWRPWRLWATRRSASRYLLWAMATGGIAWLVAVLPARAAVRTELGPPRAGRYAFVALIGAVLFLPLAALGVRVMEGFLVSVVGLGCVLLWLRRDRWPLAVNGAIGFGCINLLAMKITLALSPNYYDQMTEGALSGVTVWGLAIEEVYRAFATGAVWPLVVLHTFGTEPAAVRGPLASARD